jgi:putative membrane protein
MNRQRKWNAAALSTVAAALLFAAGGCSESSYAQSLPQQNTPDGGEAPSDSEDICMEPRDRGDGQTGGVVLEANSGEVHEGVIAAGKATSMAVRDFANQMIRDHNMANDQLLAAMADMGLKAQDSALRRRLSSTAEEQINALWSQSPGAAFDRLYMTGQVRTHRAVLRLIEERLLPGTDNTTLQQYLQTVRDAVRQHLMRAEEVLGELGGGNGMTGADAGPMNGGG